MTRIIVFFLLLLSPIVRSYTDESINLLIRSSTTSNIQRYCIELAKLPNNNTINITTFGWHTPYLASPSVNACNISDLNSSLPSSFSSNTILILYEHDCKMTEHAWNVEQQFGQKISLMIITNRTNTVYELTYNTTTMPVTIPVLIFWNNDFINLNNKYSNLSSIELSIDYPPDVSNKFRPAVLLMFLLVFIILICGNFWAGDEFKNKINEQNIDKNNQLSNIYKIPIPNDQPSSQIMTQRNSVISNDQPVSQIMTQRNSVISNDQPLSQIMTQRNSIISNDQPLSQIITKRKSITPKKKQLAVIPISYCAIVLMICFAAGWLLLLYYFPTVMIYILQVMFCIGAVSCLTSCLDRLSYFLPFLRRYRTPFHQFHKPCLYKLGPLNIFTLFAISISLTLVIIWYVYRQSDWAWILQNILGIAICMTVISIYRLGNMRVITVILIAFFLYDIFFVFITPYIPIFQQSSSNSNNNNTTSSSNGSANIQIVSREPIKNPSVMEQVALGIGTNGEVVPLLFALPMFIPESELDPCLTVRKSMLGFGDVILPGMLLTFCKIFDIASANRWPIYYIQSVISYFVGLSITHVALYLMDTAQPALLYLVPCLLISTIITSLCRRELKEIYSGKRIQALLDGTTTLHNGKGNPSGQQTNDEILHSDIVIGINDPSGVDN